MKRPAVFDHLIVGGGLAAVSAVDGILEVEPSATIAVITEESEPPYQRPPLSKEYVQYADAPRSLLYIKPEGWFDEQKNVELVTRQKVLTLDAEALTVTTARGNVFVGSRVLLATGGRARHLDVPGRDLDGVYTLRAVEDSESIREAAGPAERAVLVGAGFIGMELAGSLSSRGVRTTIVEREDRVWPGALPSVLSRWLRAHYEALQVSFKLGVTVDGFTGPDRVRAVQVGETSLPCDLVVVGVGMDPCDGLAADAGLAVTDGIEVDEFGETSHPHVFAAGDVARFPDPVFGGRTRVEHWEHAREHGRLVGRNMAGRREPYEHLSYFFSRAFEVNLDVVGRPAGADRTVLWGTPGEGPCAALGLSEGRLCGIVLLDAQAQLEAARELVRLRAPAGLLEAVDTADAVSLRRLADVAGKSGS